MRISVALCTYNGERFLSEQLQSIFDQTTPVDEIVVCDDRSKDGTIGIIDEFKSKYPGIITVNVNSSNLGSKYNFEKVISLSTGDIIFLSDQDDIWLKHKVSRILREFDKDPTTLMVFTDGSLIDENGNILESTLWHKWGFNEEMRISWKDNANALADLLQNKNKVTGATVAIRKELKKYILPFQLKEGYWHDAWIATNAAKRNGLRFLEESLIQYRVHPDQLVGIGNGTIFNTGSQPTTFYTRQKRRLLNLFNKLIRS